MRNLITARESVKVKSGISLPQDVQNPRDPQARPRWELVRELRKAAAMTSEDFWLWWFMLSKVERRTLLDAMA